MASFVVADTEEREVGLRLCEGFGSTALAGATESGLSMDVTSSTTCAEARSMIETGYTAEDPRLAAPFSFLRTSGSKVIKSQEEKRTMKDCVVVAGDGGLCYLVLSLPAGILGQGPTTTTTAGVAGSPRSLGVEESKGDGVARRGVEGGGRIHAAAESKRAEVDQRSTVPPTVAKAAGSGPGPAERGQSLHFDADGEVAVVVRLCEETGKEAFAGATQTDLCVDVSATTTCKEARALIVDELVADDERLQKGFIILRTNGCKVTQGQELKKTMKDCVVVVGGGEVHEDRYLVLSLPAGILGAAGEAKDDAFLNAKSVVGGDELGEGAYGVVRKGTLQLFGEKLVVPVAIKTVLQDKVRVLDEKKKQALKEENARAVELFHPFVTLTLGEIDKPGEGTWMVMELCDKGDLKSFMDNKQKDDGRQLAHALQILFSLQILSAMRYLHEDEDSKKKKMVHRDFAARNVFVVEHLGILTAKLGDFGMSRETEGRRNIYYFDTTFDDKTKKINVPVQWTAPEVFEKQGGEYLATTEGDMWAIGVGMHEMASCGKDPYLDEGTIRKGGKTRLENIDQVPDFIRKGGRLAVPDDCPVALQCAMEWCWEVQLKDRPSAGGLAAAILDSEMITAADWDVPTRFRDHLGDCGVVMSDPVAKSDFFAKFEGKVVRDLFESKPQHYGTGTIRTDKEIEAFILQRYLDWDKTIIDDAFQGGIGGRNYARFIDEIAGIAMLTKALDLPKAEDRPASGQLWLHVGGAVSEAELSTAKDWKVSTRFRDHVDACGIKMREKDGAKDKFYAAMADGDEELGGWFEARKKAIDENFLSDSSFFGDYEPDVGQRLQLVACAFEGGLHGEHYQRFIDEIAAISAIVKFINKDVSDSTIPLKFELADKVLGARCAQDRESERRHFADIQQGPLREAKERWAARRIDEDAWEIAQRQEIAAAEQKIEEDAKAAADEAAARHAQEVQQLVDKVKELEARLAKAEKAAREQQTEEKRREARAVEEEAKAELEAARAEKERAEKQALEEEEARAAKVEAARAAAAEHLRRERQLARLKEKEEREKEERKKMKAAAEAKVDAAVEAAQRAIETVDERQLRHAVDTAKRLELEANDARSRDKLRKVAAEASELCNKVAHAKEKLHIMAAHSTAELEAAIEAAEKLGFGARAPEGSDERRRLDAAKAALKKIGDALAAVKRAMSRVSENEIEEAIDHARTLGLGRDPVVGQAIDQHHKIAELKSWWQEALCGRRSITARWLITLTPLQYEWWDVRSEEAVRGDMSKYARRFKHQDEMAADLAAGNVVSIPFDDMELNATGQVPVHIWGDGRWYGRGIVHLLGTSAFQRPWANPAVVGAGKMAVTVSSLAHGKAEDAVGICGACCCTEDEPDQWFQFEFLNHEVQPEKYALRHGWKDAGTSLRHWRLEASHDGREWRTLRQHDGDTSLNSDYAAASWDIPGSVGRFYRFFRVLQTGENSGGRSTTINRHVLSVSGFELWGGGACG